MLWSNPWATALIAVGVVIGAYSSMMLGRLYERHRLLFGLSRADNLRLCMSIAWGIQRFYSQYEQDKWVVLKACRGVQDGFYVDVGAADGLRWSNTKLLDQRGWKGICIDPLASNMEGRRCRVFREIVYSVAGEAVTFRKAGLLSGIDMRGDASNGDSKVQVTTTTLNDILKRAEAPARIDYLSVDVEGAELEVLKGLSFDDYTVEALTVEHNNQEPRRTEIRRFLQSKGYTCVGSYMTDDWYCRHYSLSSRMIQSH